MTKWMWALLLMLAGLTGGAAAEEEITYHGCLDAAGKAVPSVADPTIATLVETRTLVGIPTILYNPDVLPRLRPATRLFLYAHECARHNLGLPAGQSPSLADARQADCWGLATLVRSGLVQAGDVAAIQADLEFSPDEWRRLPGPPRAFALPACMAEMDARPSLVSPSSGQPGWNACVRRCGDTLKSCQQRCSGAACAPCDRAYEQCSSLCDFRSPP